MACKKKLYFNPIEIPNQIRYISSARNLDIQYDTEDLPEDFPCWFDDLFAAIKHGDFDEIIVSVSAHEDCYYPEKVDAKVYKRIPLTGEIALSQFSKGGGYLEDKHIYVD